MLIIRTTGLDPNSDAGTPRIRALIIGGPGVGKTRWASSFPKPMYADCEDGLGSLLDKQLPYVSVNDSKDMLDLLEYLRVDNARAKDKRTIETVVIDTVDAYQRKLKDEWVRINKAQSFDGWDAWRWLADKQQLLLTRLLNLDMNVIINVHPKDTIVKEGDKDVHRYGLQLQGDISTTIFNDLNLVGWIGTYWEAQEGERVQKRGLTFTPTPDKAFLKDRFNITPKWLPVTFEQTDYTNLFERLRDKLSHSKESAVVGEIPDADPEAGNRFSEKSQAVSPEAAGSGALPKRTVDEPKMPLEQLDRPTLAKMARDLGVPGIKGNTIKSELITAIRAMQANAPAAPALPITETDAVPGTPARQELEKLADRHAGPAPTVNGTETVDKATGEISQDEAISTVESTLGANVIDDAVNPDPPADETPAAETCDDCSNAFTKADADFVKISKIRFRPGKPGAVTNGLCKTCFDARKRKAA